MRKMLIGSLLGIVLSVGTGAALLPWRSTSSIATDALVMMLPVVAGALIGGFVAGLGSVAVGALVLDYWFLPPYGRLSIGHAQDWVALAVYVVMVVLVSSLVTRLEAARAATLSTASDSERLFDLSELLVEERSVDDLLDAIASAVKLAFDLPGVTVLVPREGRLEVAVSAGTRLTHQELQGLEPLSGVPVGLGTGPARPDEVRTLALATSSQAFGMLAMQGLPASPRERALLRTFANNAAVALERAQLREQAMHSKLLAEVERLQRTLLGAVSHDLRTPLATMKVASSTLLHPVSPLSDADVDELHQLIDAETDRLTRMVTSLLDVTRIETGVLQVRPVRTRVAVLVREAVAAVGSILDGRSLDLAISPDLPDVEIDGLLIGQVLANLIENAARHSPPDSRIAVTGAVRSGRVAISVADEGPCVPAHERDAIFDRYDRFDTGGRGGLGLTIAKTFVAAHGERIWVEEAPAGGTRFVFTLPLCADEPARA